MFAAIELKTLIDEQNNLEKLPAGTTLKIIAEDDAVIPVSLHKALSRTKLKEDYIQSPGPLTDRFWLGFLIGTFAAGNEQGYFVSGESEDIKNIMSGKLKVVPSLKNITAPQKRARKTSAAKAEQPASGTENAAPKRCGSKPAAEAEEEPAPVPAEIMPEPETHANTNEMTKEEEDMMHERFQERLNEVEPKAADEWAKILIAVQDSTSASGASKILKSIVPQDLLGIATKAVAKDYKTLKQISSGI